MTGPNERDRALLAAALRGEAGAAEPLMRTFADPVWTACRRVTTSEAEARPAFEEIMAALAADKFSRLKGYDGRAPVQTYVALVVRDLLSVRAIGLLAVDSVRGWRAFEAFFGLDIRRIIGRLLPGADHAQDREDAYQTVCEALLKNDRQRLRAYTGRGSPAGFILHMVENLVVDHVRTILPRRRLPAAIGRLAALDQAVFRLIHWNDVDPSPAILLCHLTRPGEAPPTPAAIAEALARVRQALPAGFCGEPRSGAIPLVSGEEITAAVGAEEFGVRTPEEALADDEETKLLERALGVLRNTLPALAPLERLYLQYALAGHPAREIARLTGLPAEDIHGLAQKVKRRLRDELGSDEAVKRWRLSV